MGVKAGHSSSAHYLLQILSKHANKVTESELNHRKKNLSLKTGDFGSGALWKFSKTVGSARYGAVTHPGAKKEKKTFSDI